MPAISLFWCCLNPRERNVLTALLAFYALGTGYITEDEYTVLWATQGYLTTNKLVVVFDQTYGLRKSQITDIEGNVIDIRVFDGWFWPALVIFSFENGLFCANKCSYLTFPL